MYVKLCAWVGKRALHNLGRQTLPFTHIHTLTPFPHIHNLTPFPPPRLPTHLNRSTRSRADALPASWCAAIVALRCPPAHGRVGGWVGVFVAPYQLLGG